MIPNIEAIYRTTGSLPNDGEPYSGGEEEIKVARSGSTRFRYSILISGFIFLMIGLCLVITPNATEEYENGDGKIEKYMRISGIILLGFAVLHCVILLLLFIASRRKTHPTNAETNGINNTGGQFGWYNTGYPGQECGATPGPRCGGIFAKCRRNWQRQENEIDSVPVHAIGNQAFWMEDDDKPPEYSEVALNTTFVPALDYKVSV